MLSFIGSLGRSVEFGMRSATATDLASLLFLLFKTGEILLNMFDLRSFILGVFLKLTTCGFEKTRQLARKIPFSRVS